MPGTDNNELSEREREILRLIATGASNKEIAQKLLISANTVKVHLRNIFTKIQVASRTEAAMYAVRIGLVEAVSARQPAPEDELVGEDSLAAVSVIRDQSLTQGEPAHRPFRLSWRVVSVVVILISLAGAWALWSGQVILVGATPPPAPTPNTIRFLKRAVLSEGRQDLAAAAYGDRIYAIGGKTAQGVSGATDAYDPKADSWTAQASKPTPVYEVSAAVIGGIIYIPGGRLASGAPTNVMEAYDPHLNQWEQRASLPAAVSAYALATFEGRLYLFGGWDGQRYFNTVFKYDPATDTWSESAAMPTARAFAGAAVAGGKIYVLGGSDGKKALTANEYYVPDRDTGHDDPWGRAAPLPSPRYNMAVTGIADLVLVIGGRGDSDKNTSSLVSYQFRPEGNEWGQLDDIFPKPWTDFGSVALGTNIYFFGGQVSGVLSAQSYTYQAIYTAAMPIIGNK